MNFSNLINQFLNNPEDTDKPATKSKGNIGSLATGAALGGVAGYLANSSSGRQIGRKAMRLGQTAAGIGGLAMIGGLAYKAYTSYKNQNDSPKDHAQINSAPSNSMFNPNNKQIDTSYSGLIILRAMIAASDGEIDEEEQARIFRQIHESTLSNEEHSFLIAEMGTPLKAKELAEQSISQEMAIQVYSAALLAIDVDTMDERKFILDLQKSLNIEDDLAEQIGKEVK